MTERERGQIIRKRIARNWLGSIKIPFSNIYVNGRVNTNIFFLLQLKINLFLLVRRQLSSKYTKSFIRLCQRKINTIKN